eukprot:TRINITY_DN1927_c0_g1_i2.p1 TRINITY_DN1927_c0_g1~~TRINITY_DN1927_c0_g1_i2.p1  ORF type:complete len:102 (-),score=7.76 TRINITY_DN1927_c0_g1_i2:660-965(-)
MERADLLLKNAEVFASQGKALDKVSLKDKTHVWIVGNPANTNAMIASRNAPSIPVTNFSAMTMLVGSFVLESFLRNQGIPSYAKGIIVLCLDTLIVDHCHS